MLAASRVEIESLRNHKKTLHFLSYIKMPLLLLRNVLRSEGLTNGTRLLLKQIEKNVLVCEIQSENQELHGNRVFIYRCWCCLKAGKFAFDFRRFQFPVRPAFAMT